MKISHITNNNTNIGITNQFNNNKKQTSFGGYIMLFSEQAEKIMGRKKNKAILEALENSRKGKVGDVKIWDSADGNRKCLFGAVDQWSDMVVIRAVSDYQQPNESSIDFIKRMCKLADSVKESDYTIDLKSTLLKREPNQTSPNIFQRIWNKITGK